MFLSRVIPFLALCWVVHCDLLDLYVQHMDETMKTIVYQKSHVKNLARGRNKRETVVPAFYKFGNFKKQRIEVDEEWGQHMADKKSLGREPESIFIEKDDGLEFENAREENLDSKHFETMGEASTKRNSELKQQTEKRKNIHHPAKDDGLETKNPAEETADSDEDFELIETTTGRTESSSEIQRLPELSYSEATDMGGQDPGEEFELKVLEEALDEERKTNSVTEIETDVDLDVELVNQPGNSSGEKNGWNPPLKRNPKALGGLVPKKYAPAMKDVKSRRKLTGEESASQTRTKRSATKPRFSRREELDDDGLVILEWDPTDEEIVTFRVTAKTLGYVGIGFNEKSHMKGADILLAWIDNHNGHVNLLDSHGIKERNAAPVTDVSQDVKILEGVQNDTHTTVVFSRMWHTCDPEDHQLTEDTVHVLWALHETDPELNNAAGHDEKRGGRALRLKAPAPHPPPVISTPDVRRWDIKLNRYTVSKDQDTVYWCKIFKAPDLNGTHHMIGYTPLIEKANEALVHHIILYECASMEPILGAQARLAGAACYSSVMPKAWNSCLQPVVAWARGSKGEWFPDHVGIPIGEHREASYYMLEVHYNNPEFRQVEDSSGITLYLTPKLRPQEAGILVAGVAVSPLHMVPPRQKEFATAGYCTPHCTNNMFPEDGINIVSVVLHSHLAGRRLGLKHIRQGKELPRIVQDNHFDFNYQQSHTMDTEVKVLPGDELVVECVYGTLDRAHPTLGGYAATQEMCLAFIVHYPRTELAACYSMTPVKDFFKTLGVHSFKGITFDELEKNFLTTGNDTVTLPTTTQLQPNYPVARPGGEIDEKSTRRDDKSLSRVARDYPEDPDDDNIFARLIIDKPEEFQGRTFAEHMQKIPWTEELLTRQIEHGLYYGKHMTFCRKRDDILAMSPDIQMFPNFTALPEANETICDALKSVSSWNTPSVHPILVALVVSVFYFRLIPVRL